MAQITFNLSKTSRDPGWDPSSEFHDELWQSFAAGYKYRVVGGNGTVFDSLRGSDPATRGTSDTFDSSAGSLDLTASNFSGNVSLDWLDNGRTARLALDSAWNTIKNAYVGSFTGDKLILENWVDAWVELDNDFAQQVIVDGSKRAEISTGSGNDTIWIGVDSSGSGWTNVIKVDSGDGDDVITIARSTRDYSGSAFSAAYVASWTTTEVHGGSGSDRIAGSESADNVDGGEGTDIFVLHGSRASYQVAQDGNAVTITDLRTGAANRDGVDHLVDIERLQFDDGVLVLATSDEGHGTGIITADFSFTDVVTSAAPFFFTATLDFGDDPYDSSDFSELSAGAREIMSAAAPGSSSAVAEAFAFDLLAREAEATLIKTEDEVAYGTGSKKVDFVAELSDTRFGVSVDRAFSFPPGTPVSVEDASERLTRELNDLKLASADVAPADHWDETMLVVFAIDEQAAQSVREAWNQLDATTRGDTTVVVVQTDGTDDFLFFV